MNDNNFVKLASINVNDHVEKKNGLSYLSWPFAVSELMKADPLANWTFHEPMNFGESMMVSCTVTAFGKPITMHLPVMDHRNQAIKNPDAFQVNKNMMRCLVKAIACHGLGLYIYAGEDLPEQEEKPVPKPNHKPVAQEAFEKMDAEEQEYLRNLHRGVMEASDMYMAYELAKESLDSEEQVAFWSLFDSKQRAALKKAKATHDQLEVAGQA